MSWSLVSWVLINQGLIHWGLLLNLGSLDLTLVVAISTVLFWFPTILIFGLAVVWYGRKTGWFDLVRHRWRTVPEFPWLKFAAAACETYSWMLSRNNNCGPRYPRWEPEQFAIVRLSAIVPLGSSYRFGGNCCDDVVERRAWRRGAHDK
ncbi:hypothetical protein Tco_1176105 [Tanacetum coccineum]